MDTRTLPPAPSHPLRWLPEFLEFGRKRIRNQARVMAAAMLVGVVAGLGAMVFHYACQAVAHVSLDRVVGYRPSHPTNEKEVFPETETSFRPWLLLIVPAVGGLLSGVIVYTFAPEAEGHGTDAAIAAYHYQQGQIRPRVPLVKILTSALTLGTGGSGGREGPIAQIGAGFGSFLGNVLRLRPAERRILMAAGMGAGVAAIFRAPLAGALFAAEVLYSSPEFEAEVIIPAGLASAIAYSTFGLAHHLFGLPFDWLPLFQLPEDPLGTLTFTNPLRLLPYLLLALFMVLLAMLYTRSFYGLTHLFHRLRMPRKLKPMLGAFLTGVVGLGLYLLFHGLPGGQAIAPRVLAVMSFGYGSLQDSLTEDPAAGNSLLLAGLLLAISLGKIATTGLTIGSGGSGGVFGPSMVIGGCGGGALGIVLHHLLPESMVPPLAAFVIVGMAGFFAAAAKTPFSTLVIVTEMTGGYGLLLPALWVCAISFLLSDEQSIYSSQLPSRSLSPAHQGDYVRTVLAGLSIRQFLKEGREVPLLRAGDSLATVLERLDATPYPVLPVVDASDRLLGVVSLEEVHLAAQLPSVRPLLVAADLMRTDVVPLRPEYTLDRAIELFTENDLLALPVVEGDGEKRVVGVVRRADVSSAYVRQLHGSPRAEETP